jgi:activator of HSP90 ATPase
MGEDRTMVMKNLATRRQWIATSVLAAGSVALLPTRVSAAEPEGISHSAEAIHQEPTFAASPQRVYEVLMDSQQFDKVIQASGVMQSAALQKMKKPTEISREVGGAFTLFGGYIFGRHLEVAPNELVVQAWRVGSWDRGLYSIVRFELTAAPGGTKLVFDHTGFPKGDAEHLAEGWRAHYWEPMRKVLA